MFQGSQLFRAVLGSIALHLMVLLATPTGMAHPPQIGIFLNQSTYAPGDLLSLNLVLANTEELVPVLVTVQLDIAGATFFWPGWTTHPVDLQFSLPPDFLSTHWLMLFPLPADLPDIAGQFHAWMWRSNDGVRGDLLAHHSTPLSITRPAATPTPTPRPTTTPTHTPASPSWEGCIEGRVSFRVHGLHPEWRCTPIPGDLYCPHEKELVLCLAHSSGYDYAGWLSLRFRTYERRSIGLQPKFGVMIDWGSRTGCTGELNVFDCPEIEIPDPFVELRWWVDSGDQTTHVETMVETQSGQFQTTESRIDVPDPGAIMALTDVRIPPHDGNCGGWAAAGWVPDVWISDMQYECTTYGQSRQCDD